MNVTRFLQVTGWILLAAGCCMAQPPTNTSPAATGNNSAAAPTSADQSNAVPAANEPKRHAVRRPSIGFQVFYFGTPFFKTNTTTVSETTPVIANYTYVGGTSSPKLAVGLTGEYRLTDRWSVGLEFRFHHVDFSQTTTILSGVVNPNASTDDQQPITLTQHTQASYWEVPVLAHYYGLRRSGLLTHAFATGGWEFRYISNIRTGTDFSYPGGGTYYDEIPVSSGRDTQFGAVVGLGLRFIDAFNIKVSPEVRFIRWMGATFQGQGQGFSAAANELEGGIGISF
jgi:Outer membrane protein beta-barrel domain